MAETAVPDYPRGVTFEQVWAGLQETRLMMRENAEAQKEAGRRFEETRLFVEETGRQIRQLEQQMGGLHRSFGEMAEHLVAPGIAERFNELGHHFDRVAPGGIKIADETGKVQTEVDLLLENTDCIIAVEVKATVHIKDVEHHIGRLEILRAYWNKKGDNRKIRGAIAGAIFGETEKEAVIEAGMYALEQSGDTMHLVIPEGFIPRDW